MFSFRCSDPAPNDGDGDGDSDSDGDGEAGQCGDGVIEGDEACDDGENNSDELPDACRTDCTEPGCGDGVEDSGEGRIRIDADGYYFTGISTPEVGFDSGLSLLCP